MADDQDAERLRAADQIAIAYLGNPANPVDTGHVAETIERIYLAVLGFRLGGVEPSVDTPRPAVPITESVGDDFIICLEDGRRLKMLKRYLRAQHNMSPDEYREKWGLPADYPMVAPAYASQRSGMAKAQGLGRKAAPMIPLRKRAS